MNYTHTPYSYNTGASHIEIFRGRIAKMNLKDLQTVTASNERAVATYDADKSRTLTASTYPSNEEERERLAKDAARRLAACHKEIAKRFGFL